MRRRTKPSRLRIPPLSSSSVAPASHKASHALICESLESMTNARCEFSERRPHLPHLEEPFRVRCLLREPLQRYAHPGTRRQDVGKKKEKLIVVFISVKVKGRRQVGGVEISRGLRRLCNDWRECSTEIPKTKGVLSATLIPQERFGPSVGITGDFNHVMGHQATALRRFPARV